MKFFKPYKGNIETTFTYENNLHVITVEFKTLELMKTLNIGAKLVNDGIKKRVAAPIDKEKLLKLSELGKKISEGDVDYDESLSFVDDTDNIENEEDEEELSYASEEHSHLSSISSSETDYFPKNPDRKKKNKTKVKEKKLLIKEDEKKGDIFGYFSDKSKAFFNENIPHRKNTEDEKREINQKVDKVLDDWQMSEIKKERNEIDLEENFKTIQSAFYFGAEVMNFDIEKKYKEETENNQPPESFARSSNFHPVPKSFPFQAPIHGHQMTSMKNMLPINYAYPPHMPQNFPPQDQGADQGPYPPPQNPHYPLNHYESDVRYQRNHPQYEEQNRRGYYDYQELDHQNQRDSYGHQQYSSRRNYQRQNEVIGNYEHDGRYEEHNYNEDYHNYEYDYQYNQIKEKNYSLNSKEFLPDNLIPSINQTPKTNSIRSNPSNNSQHNEENVYKVKEKLKKKAKKNFEGKKLLKRIQPYSFTIEDILEIQAEVAPIIQKKWIKLTMIKDSLRSQKNKSSIEIVKTQEIHQKQKEEEEKRRRREEEEQERKRRENYNNNRKRRNNGNFNSQRSNHNRGKVFGRRGRENGRRGVYYEDGGRY